ncbi:MAG: hypothetical protein CL676_05480 [Bdellovibrionaceae bacterium]|nr:hypothetical protein [Pseudobdellovibrionaceae bacterium]|tara:strand:- start:1420 stop:2187 length:768 start_codon:yes stop_codon:yes gene_type:complete
MKKPAFMNFQVDHMTLLLQPRLYNVAYCLFRILFGVRPEDILYDKRKEWVKGEGEQSMTYALKIGEADDTPKEIQNTIIAVVQPSEPQNQSSHVREMLDGHEAAAHWQHIALRTPDLLAFHKHALERGVQFVTPILRDDEDDLIQVFSGEWYFPGSKPSGMFFEFLERSPSDAKKSELEKQTNQTWFRDRTFLGLYDEKEREYQSGEVTPFIAFELFEQIEKYIGSKKSFEITADDLNHVEQMMMEFARKKAESN